MRIINVISRTDAYILIRDLNLKPKAAGTIDVDILIVSELKSLRNLSMANDIIISEIDFDYVIDKIATLSGGGTASYPELPVATKNSLGGVIVSDYLKIDTSGQLSVDFETIIETTVESATSGLEQTLGAQYTQIIPNGNSVIIDGTPKFGHSISVKLIEGTHFLLLFPEANEDYTLDVYIGTTSAKHNIYAPSNDVTLVAHYQVDVVAHILPKFYVDVFSSTEASLVYNIENILRSFNFTDDTSWLNIIAVVNDGIDQDKVQELVLDGGLDSFPIRINTSSQANFPAKLASALQETEATFNTQLNTVSIQASETQTLAQTNELKIGTKADQADLDITDQQVEQNRLAILTKADISALAQLALLVDTKADQAYVNQQIADLVDSAPEALNTVYELASAIQAEQGIVDALNQSVANRVRFDIAEQALTEIQKQNARTNIDAEKIGTAQQLVSQITAQSLGAATAVQGAKADTALQISDVAPVAFSGLFTSLANQNKIFDVVFNAYTIGSNTAISATDTLGQMLGKLQAQISNSSNSSGFTWVNADQIPGLTLTAPVQHKSLKFAKKDGILWVCGSLHAQGSTNASTKFFNISNSAYMVEQHVTNFYGAESQVAVCNITAHQNTLGSPPNNVNALAMFYVLNTNLYLRTSYGFNVDGGFIAFKPTPIGRLLN